MSCLVLGNDVVIHFTTILQNIYKKILKNKHKRQDGVKETVSSPQKSLLHSPQHARESKTNMPQITSPKGLEGKKWDESGGMKGNGRLQQNCFSNQPSLSERPSLVCSEFQTRLNF